MNRYCWGVGGSIGNHSMHAANEPVRLGDDTSISGQRFMKVSCGGSFTLAVTRRGKKEVLLKIDLLVCFILCDTNIKYLNI